MPPILSNAALMVLRLFGASHLWQYTWCGIFDLLFFFSTGRYLHMIDLLEPIGFDVAVSLSQLFEYYFYCVSKIEAVEIPVCESFLPDSGLPFLWERRY